MIPTDYLMNDPADWQIHWWMIPTDWLIRWWIISIDWFVAKWSQLNDWFVDEWYWLIVEWSRLIRCWMTPDWLIDSMLNDRDSLIRLWIILIEWYLLFVEWSRLIESVLNDTDWLTDSLIMIPTDWLIRCWLTDCWWMIPIDWLIHCWHITPSHPPRSHFFNKPQIRSQTLLRYVTSMLEENREIQNFADWTWKAKMN